MNYIEIARHQIAMALIRLSNFNQDDPDVKELKDLLEASIENIDEHRGELYSEE